MYGVENVFQTFQNYGGTTMFFPLFFVCLIYCYRKAEETGKKRLVWYGFLAVLILFNDISRKIIGKFTDVSTYYRFIWAVPVLIVIAYVFCCVWKSSKGKKEKALVLVLSFFALILGQSSFLYQDCFRLPPNEYNVSNDVLETCDIIKEHKQKERPVVIFDLEIQMSARLYDPSLIWGISRKAYIEQNNMEDYHSAGKYKNQKILIQAVNYGDKSAGEDLRNALRKGKVDYIVTSSDYDMDEYLQQLGCEVAGRSSTRTVYFNKDLEGNH